MKKLGMTTVLATSVTHQIISLRGPPTAIHVGKIQAVQGQIVEGSEAEGFGWNVFNCCIFAVKSACKPEKKTRQE